MPHHPPVTNVDVVDVYVTSGTSFLLHVGPDPPERHLDFLCVLRSLSLEINRFTRTTEIVKREVGVRFGVRGVFDWGDRFRNPFVKEVRKGLGT